MLACVVGAGVLVASWAVIGFAGFVDYPSSPAAARATLVGEDSYTAYIVGLDLGLPSLVARACGSLSGLRSWSASSSSDVDGDERTAFIVAVAASLALTPIVWLHYFALLLVVVALAQPRLGVVLVRPARDVRDAGERTPDPVRDGLDARRRSARPLPGDVGLERPSGDARAVERAPARRQTRDRVGRLGRARPARSCRRHRGARARARVDARRVGRDGRVGGVLLFVVVHAELHELPRVGSTSGTWCRRSGARRTGIRSR